MSFSRESVVRRTISRIRPNASLQGLSLRAFVGWYLRKGLFPLLRGSAQLGFFQRADFPLFIGARVSISYRRKMRVGMGVYIGAGSVIQAYSTLGISLRDRVTIREGAWIQCSSSPALPGVSLLVGEGTYIGPRSVIGVGGPVNIGAGCQIGAEFIAVAENHVVADGRVSAEEVTRRGISIGDRCWIGHRVTVLDGVALGDDCIVGAGAVVTRSFPANSKIAGIPARVIG